MSTASLELPNWSPLSAAMLIVYTLAGMIKRFLEKVSVPQYGLMESLQARQRYVVEGKGLASQRGARNVSSAGMRELQFYVSSAQEINRRFAGKHIAIIGDKVVASGKSPMEVWKRAKKLHPQGKPVLAFVPKDDTLLQSSSVRLSRLRYRDDVNYSIHGGD